jgi:anti-sigma factor ChrR (cupin superfamily)
VALQQDIKPVNSEIQDCLVKAREGEWIKYAEGAWLKILHLGSESGSWTVLFRWNKGFVAPPHKHLSGSHTFVLKGRLQVRDGVLDAGDYVYEPNGMLHGQTTALEDTEYLFVCSGPIVSFSDEAITGYFGWEELVRMRERNQAAMDEVPQPQRAAV